MMVSYLSTKFRKILHQNIHDHEAIECPICSGETLPYWEPKYNGIRATCTRCGINWAECHDLTAHTNLIFNQNFQEWVGYLDIFLIVPIVPSMRRFSSFSEMASGGTSMTMFPSARR